MYTSGRFFTMTGRTGADARPIIAAHDAFAKLAEELRTQSASSRTGEGDLPNAVPESGEQPAKAETHAWFSKLPSGKQSEVVKYAALHVARNSKLFELSDNGGNYQDYLKLALSLARSGVAEAEDIFVEAASTAKEADTDEALRSFFKNCEGAQPRTNGVTVGTLFHVARKHGADFSPWKAIDRVSLADFHAYMPMHTYIFVPSREMWPASSVDARLDSVPLYRPDGTPALDEGGQQKKIVIERGKSLTSLTALTTASHCVRALAALNRSLTESSAFT
jgi:hypothetical protein